MLFGLMAAFFVVFSWLAGYWLNGLYGMKFQIDSCWQGVSACGIGLVGLLKWLIDSSKNSPIGEPPAVVAPPLPPLPQHEPAVKK